MGTVLVVLLAGFSNCNARLTSPSSSSAAASTLGLHGTHISEWTSLFVAPGPGDNAVYLAPEKFNHTLLGPVGKGTTAHWYAAQWNNPYELLPQGDRAFGSFVPRAEPMQCASDIGASIPLAWNATTPSAGICAFESESASAPGWQLLQDGSELDCGIEYDLFLSPTGSNYPGYPTGIHATPNLTAMSALRVSMTLRLSEATVSDRCGTSPQCAGSGHVDYGYVVLGLIGSSTPAGKTPQTLFYQVLLSDTRQTLGCGGGSDCAARETEWYFKSNPFGANDAIASFNQSCLRPGAPEATVFEFDALPLYKRAVQTGPQDGSGSFNTDTSQWSIDGVYLGMGMQGSVRQSLFVQDFDVSWN